MFKVSFKETAKDPAKAVTKVGLTTTVILKGMVKLPEFFDRIPADIMEWIGHQNKVEIYENMATQTMQIFSTGISKCHEDDKYDSVLGERLAEARAKYCIYKFFYDLDTRLCNYYSNILHGYPYDIKLEDKGLLSNMHKYEALCIREAQHIGQLLADKQNG